MAKNDTILVDGILSQRQSDKLPSSDLGEVFEYLVLEQVLKNYDLDTDEIKSGWVDGRDDGGIDGFYLFVNGHLLQDTQTFQWPRSSPSLELYIINCKHHSTFKEATLNTLYSTSAEFFDLSKREADLLASYSSTVKSCREKFIAAYKRIAILNPSFKINIIYASRGDNDEIGASISARSEQIRSVIGSYFSNADVEFRFFGSSEIVSEFRRQKKFSLVLPFDEALSGSGSSYIVTTKLIDYYRFVSDENGKLRRYLFDSNVRDYLNNSRVNEDIAKSLDDESIPDFWWLNNGVTILGSNATIVSSKQIEIQDIQIVNGLQTTESLFRHFDSGNKKSTNRSLAVKIIVSQDAAVLDKIIRATNNQNSVELASLHATDKIQRDIEQILEKSEWYYERRKNYYKNDGRPSERLLTPMFMASGYVALCMKNPTVAASLKPKFMRNPASYSSVFSDQAPIAVWPRIAKLLRAAEHFLQTIPSPLGGRTVANWRGVLALVVAGSILKTFAYSEDDFAALDTDQITPQLMSELWNIVSEVRGEVRVSRRPSAAIIMSICKEISKEKGVVHPEAVGRRGVASSVANSAADRLRPTPTNLTDEFVNAVDMLLPQQPWPIGIHREVAEKLGRRSSHVSAAIQKLISDGRRSQQRDGRLVDQSDASQDAS